MMARSTRGSNQRPDTLMQDRTSANSMKVLLQRTAGPYIWVICDRGGRSHMIVHVRFAPKADKQQTVWLRPLCAMCGRLRVGKAFLHVCRLVGAAMCSACLCGSHDRWP